MADPQNEIYMIWCVLEDEVAGFPIEIESSKPVGVLKDKIKTVAADKLANVGARHLKLYQVEIPVNEDVAAAVDLKLSQRPAELPSWEKLSKVFKDGLKEKMVHIIAQSGVATTAPKTPSSLQVLNATPEQTGPPNLATVTAVELPSSTLKRKRKDLNVPEPSKRTRLQLLPDSLTIYKTEAEPGKSDALACLPTQVGFRALTSLYNLIAVDKTQYIELLDRDAEYQYMFLRPRRWGKTTFLQTLMEYYNKANKDRFNDIFHDLYIGKHPTTGRSSLLVLRFDFSSVSGVHTRETMKQQFDRMVNVELERFLKANQAFLGVPDLTLVDASDGTKSLMNVLRLVEERGEGLFVGVDEYDAPANTVLFSPHQDRYEEVADFFKTQFFAVMKNAATTVVKKYWITGVLPVFRDGISPLAAAAIISDRPAYNGLCGLTDAEVRAIAQSYLSAYQPQELEKALSAMKKWYNGYVFFRKKHAEEVESLHNPQLIFNHLRGLANKQLYIAPLEEIGALHMSSVLAALPDTGEASFLDTYTRAISSGIPMKVVYQFGAGEVRLLGKDASVTWNLLYFFGVLTHTPEDSKRLRIANVTMRHVIFKRFSLFLNKEPQLAAQSSEAYDGLLKGDVQPLIKLLELFFNRIPARAVRDCNEAAFRTALSVFWSNQAYISLPELSLLVDPRAQSGEGRSGFLDLFLPCSPAAPCIELKNIPLEALWKGQNGPGALRSDMTLEILRGVLRGESDDKLLERKVQYGREKPVTVEDVKTEAFKQITRYLEVMKDGVASTSNNHRGVHDSRVEHTEEECELIGYVVILVGGTKVLAWRVTNAQTEVTWQITEQLSDDLIF